MAVARHRGLVARGAAVALAFALATTSIVITAGGAGADNYPGLDDIAAAKAAVSNQQATVDELDAAIVQLAEAAQAAQVEAQLAGERYVDARMLADAARKAAAAAAREAKRAEAELAGAQDALAAVAMATYRNGGGLTQLEAIVGADGFEDIIARTEDLDRAASEVDAVVQRVRAAEVVAETTADLAAEAAKEAEDAALAAAAALAEAEDAQRVADQAVADAEATRQGALERLAQLQRTTVALQEQRQEGLANERDQRAREAYERALAEAEGTTAPPASGGGTSTPPPASGGGASTPPPASGGGASTPPPATGGWASTDAQGAGASAHAQTLMGAPYLLGGNGPSYDCSGLTSAAWKSQGITLPRSSKTQYAGTTHVSLSQLRPGDLVFYGTNRDPSRIYHVALYIGNGLVAEATSPGKVSQIRAYDASWRIGNLIPVAGRP